MKEEVITLRICDRSGERTQHSVTLGSNLREALMEMGISPYEGKFKKLNCKGMGVCGTCKVIVLENQEEWERRSCQIQCFKDLEIRLK